METIPNREPDGKILFRNGVVSYWNMEDHRVFVLPLKDGRECIISDGRLSHDISDEYKNELLVFFFNSLCKEYAKPN